MPDYTQEMVELFRTHHVWAGVIIGILCLCESIAFVGLFVPATAILFAAGGLVGAGVIPMVDLIVGGVIGCLIGDTISFWLGRRLGPHADRVWPFRTRPELLHKGNAFFAKHGWWGVFTGRFFGPLRAVVPLSAGIMKMNHVQFQAVSVASAVLFVPAMLAPGAVVAKGVEGASQAGGLMAVPALIIMLAPIGIAIWWVLKKRGGTTAG